MSSASAIPPDDRSGSPTASGRGRKDRRTLGTAFDPRNNSLNALRLMLATLVIVSHAWPLGGFGPDPEIGRVTLGTWAVAGFFGISGFLIASSRLRSPLLPYLWRRFLRIFPGLWACLLVIGLVFAPIDAWVEPGPDHVLSTHLVRFIVADGLLQEIVGIGGTLSNVPSPHAWDGSLWTLYYEFGCYLILGLMLALPFVRKRPGPSLAVLFAVSLLLTIGAHEFNSSLPLQLRWLAYLGTYFWAGALLFVYAAQIPIGAIYVAAAAALVAVMSWTAPAAALTAMLSAVPFAFLVLWLGVTLPLQRVGRRNDISYGVYIYAFPVQQLLALAGAQRLGIGAYILLAIAATLPLAALSWLLIERPAIRLKRVIGPRPALPDHKPSVTPAHSGADRQTIPAHRNSRPFR